eukprot:COSAG02_NODE_13692_length_1361_cov_1.484152_2_plen_66_part_00
MERVPRSEPSEQAKAEQAKAAALQAKAAAAAEPRWREGMLLGEWRAAAQCAACFGATAVDTSSDF